jgi:hypothetical protein
MRPSALRVSPALTRSIPNRTDVTPTNTARATAPPDDTHNSNCGIGFPTRRLRSFGEHHSVEGVTLPIAENDGASRQIGVDDQWNPEYGRGG